MATRKFRPRRKLGRTHRMGKTHRRHRRASTAGKIMTPLDVRSNKHLSEFKKRITKGPLTIIMVYADWCGHCHTMMPHFDAASKSAKRSVQSVKLNEQMLPAVNQYVSSNINKSAKPLNVEGYPSIIVVNNKGEKVTDVEPVRDTAVMTKVMENSGSLAKEAGLLNKEANLTTANTGVTNSEEVGLVNASKKNNASMNTAAPSVNTNKNMNMNVGNKNKNVSNNASNNASKNANTSMMNADIGEDELLGSIASAKNNSMKPNNTKNTVANTKANSLNKNNSVNMKNSVTDEINITAPQEKEAEEITSLVAPVAPPTTSGDLEEGEGVQSISNSLTPNQKLAGGGKRRGGSLLSSLSQTTYTLAAPAALLATAALIMRGKKTHKRINKGKKTRHRRR